MPNRRMFVQSFAITIGFPSLINSLHANNSSWPKNIFESEEFEHALHLETGSRSAIHGSIELIAPTIAENGVKVPIEVKTELNNVKFISIYVVENPKPYVSKFIIIPKIKSYANIHIKMRKTSEVVALIETNDNIYLAKKKVTVTAGGCA